MSDRPTIPSPPLAEYEGDGEVPGAPQWFQMAINELRLERAEMLAALRATLDAVESRDLKMMDMLQTTLDRALENDTRLSRLESQVGRDSIAIRHLQAELQQMKIERARCTTI